jgi:tRNA (adenine22-N1)-methyltransferase
MVLSDRLQTIAGMTDPCTSVTDIGTDHGYLPIWLIEQGVCRHAVAADVRKGPLATAKQNCLEHGIGPDRIKTVLSDGLKEISRDDTNPDDTLIIAGMGGETIVDILSAEPEKAHSFGRFLFSPHTKQEELRRYLGSAGYMITDERYLIDAGKLYVVMKAVNGEDACATDTDYRFGPFIEKATEDRKIYDILLKRYNALSGMLEGAGLPEKRVAEIEEEIRSYKEVLKL